MKNIFQIAIIAIFLLSCSNSKKKVEEKNESVSNEINLKWMKDGNQPDGYKNGDIIFIHSNSDLSSPISLATESNYTHCAIYWNMKGTRPTIFEACSEVEMTPFNEFITEKKGSLLLVLRLKENKKIFDNLKQAKLSSSFQSWLGKEYDGKFLWSDEEMYCSELVYKLYEAAGVKLCELKKLGDFDFSSPEVQKELKARYGDKIPMKEPVIAPVDLIYSNLLDTIYFSK